jgi:hypothetical protein
VSPYIHLPLAALVNEGVRWSRLDRWSEVRKYSSTWLKLQFHRLTCSWKI